MLGSGGSVPGDGLGDGLALGLGDALGDGDGEAGRPPVGASAIRPR
ncbi:MAG: hypothetical protein U0841_02665 [Chloroflexia bacterium]